MRGGPYLEAAVDYCKDLGIKFYGINHNREQDSWTNSPKAYAQLYIDDAALGCPLTYDGAISSRPYVDWKKVEVELLLLRVLYAM